MSDLGRYALVIFDADGTLRRTTVPGQPCPRRPGEWELLPDVRRVLGRCDWPGGRPWLGLASNQDQIAYGHLTLDVARTLLRELARAATGHVPPDEALQLCPHALETACDCRKPAPGMLRRIMAYYRVPAERTLFVGDAECDREAAAGAGTAFRWGWEVFR